MEEKIRTAPLQIDIRLPECLRGARYAVTPWAEHLKIHAKYGSSQSAERIAERGGFGIKEAHEYYGWETPIVWFMMTNGYVKYKLEWKDDTIYFHKQGDKQGWVEGTNLVLPLETLERLREIVIKNTEGASQCCVDAKAGLVDELINAVKKANEVKKGE